MRLPNVKSRRRVVRDRGAMAIVIALITTLIVVPLGALAVDIGTQRVARGDMQAIADAVALDMAAALAANDPTNQPVTDAAATADASHGSGSVGSSPTVHVYLGYIPSGLALPANQARGCGGSPYDATYFQQPTAGNAANAVLVTASTTVQFGLAKALPKGPIDSGGACRSSVAQAVPSACFKVGSFAARLNSSNSALLAALLNKAGGLNLTAAGYQGLAEASVGLGPLAVALGLGSPSQLASTDVSVHDLTVAAATLLRNDGDAADADLLQNSVAANVAALGTINLGHMLGISSGSGAAAAASVNVLDLIGGAIFLANGSNLLSIPTLATNLGLTGTSLSTTVKLIEGIQMACGGVGTTASTSQAYVGVNGDLLNISVPALSGLGLGATATTNVAVNLASATGTLTNIVCGAGTVANPEGIDVSVAPQLANASVSQTFTFNGSVDATNSLLNSLLGGLLGSIVKVKVTGSLKVSAGVGVAGPQPSTTLQFRVPVDPTFYAAAKSSGSAIGSAATTVSVDASSLSVKVYTGILGLSLTSTTLTLDDPKFLQVVNGLMSSLTSTISSLLSTTMSSVVTPLANLLGLQLGGADVYAVPRPRCANGRLVG